MIREGLGPDQPHAGLSGRSSPGRDGSPGPRGAVSARQYVSRALTGLPTLRYTPPTSPRLCAWAASRAVARRLGADGAQRATMPEIEHLTARVSGRGVPGPPGPR